MINSRVKPSRISCSDSDSDSIIITEVRTQIGDGMWTFEQEQKLANIAVNALLSESRESHFPLIVIDVSRDLNGWPETSETAWIVLTGETSKACITSCSLLSMSTSY